MGEHVINFVEGDGISIQAVESVDEEKWDVEIACTVTGGGDAAFDPASAATWWVPLFDSPDGTAVLDTDGAVILTLTPIA
jgi:hypothetical protein